MIDQGLRETEPCFVGQILRDHWLSGLDREGFRSLSDRDMRSLPTTPLFQRYASANQPGVSFGLNLYDFGK